MNKLREVRGEMKKNRTLFIMLIPAVVLVFTLSYLPMTGIVLAFKNFSYSLGIWGSPWAGFDNFRYFFMSGTGWTVTKNTILYNLLNLMATQILAVAIAIMLSEIRNIRFKKLSQSAIFLPYFISWIIVGVFAYNIFDYDAGMLNKVLTAIGIEPVNVYGKPGLWWVIIPSFNAWKWVGYNSVIYIAAITAIDTACYESADIGRRERVSKNLPYHAAGDQQNRNHHDAVKHL